MARRKCHPGLLHRALKEALHWSSPACIFPPEVPRPKHSLNQLPRTIGESDIDVEIHCRAAGTSRAVNTGKRSQPGRQKPDALADRRMGYGPFCLIDLLRTEAENRKTATSNDFDRCAPGLPSNASAILTYVGSPLYPAGNVEWVVKCDLDGLRSPTPCLIKERHVFSTRTDHASGGNTKISTQPANSERLALPEAGRRHVKPAMFVQRHLRGQHQDVFNDTTGPTAIYLPYARLRKYSRSPCQLINQRRDVHH